MTIVFAMNECQLSGSQALVERCFARSEAGARIYYLTIAAAALVALILHINRSRWRRLALFAIPVAPIVALFGLGSIIL